MAEITITNKYTGESRKFETNIKKREAQAKAKRKKREVLDKKKAEETAKELDKYKKNESDIIIKRRSGEIQRQVKGKEQLETVKKAQQQNVKTEYKTSTQYKDKPNFLKDKQKIENKLAEKKTSTQYSEPNFLTRPKPKEPVSRSSVRIGGKTVEDIQEEQFKDFKEAGGTKEEFYQAQSNRAKVSTYSIGDSKPDERLVYLQENSLASIGGKDVLKNIDVNKKEVGKITIGGKETEDIITDANKSKPFMTDSTITADENPLTGLRRQKSILTTKRDSGVGSLKIGAGLFGLGVVSGVKNIVVDIPVGAFNYVKKNPLVLTPVMPFIVGSDIGGVIKKAPELVESIAKDIKQNPEFFIGEALGELGTGFVISKGVGKVTNKLSKDEIITGSYTRTTPTKTKNVGDDFILKESGVVQTKKGNLLSVDTTIKSRSNTFNIKVTDKKGKLIFQKTGDASLDLKYYSKKEIGLIKEPEVQKIFMGDEQIGTFKVKDDFTKIKYGDEIKPIEKVKTSSYDDIKLVDDVKVKGNTKIIDLQDVKYSDLDIKVTSEPYDLIRISKTEKPFKTVKPKNDLLKLKDLEAKDVPFYVESNLVLSSDDILARSSVKSRVQKIGKATPDEFIVSSDIPVVVDLQDVKYSDTLVRVVDNTPVKASDKALISYFDDIKIINKVDDVKTIKFNEDFLKNKKTKFIDTIDYSKEVNLVDLQDVKYSDKLVRVVDNTPVKASDKALIPYFDDIKIINKVDDVKTIKKFGERPIKEQVLFEVKGKSTQKVEFLKTKKVNRKTLLDTTEIKQIEKIESNPFSISKTDLKSTDGGFSNVDLYVDSYKDKLVRVVDNTPVKASDKALIPYFDDIEIITDINKVRRTGFKTEIRTESLPSNVLTESISDVKVISTFSKNKGILEEMGKRGSIGNVKILNPVDEIIKQKSLIPKNEVLISNLEIGKTATNFIDIAGDVSTNIKLGRFALISSIPAIKDKIKISSLESQAIKPKELTKIKTKEREVLKDDLVTEPIMTQVLIPTTRTKTSIATDTATDTATDLTTDTVTEQVIEPIIKVPTVITPIPTINPIIGVLPTLDDDEPKKERKKKGFFVFTRKKGEFIKIGDSALSKSDALDLGASVVSTTARASFKLVASDSPVKELKRPKVKGSFRKFGANLNLKNNIFIEKRSKRIKSIGEKAEITYKGIKANKIKGLRI